MMIKTILFPLFFLGISSAYADIYTYHDTEGKFYFTDQKMDASYKLLSVYRPKLSKQSNASYDSRAYRQNKVKYLPDIHRTAKKYNLDPLLLHAIVDTESAFNPNAVSKTGAIGLMQLMPQTAKSLGVKNSWNPLQNLRGGALYLRQLLDQFGQNIELSLAAYNAGPTAVMGAGNKTPNYPETKEYIKKVMAKYQTLR